MKRKTVIYALLIVLACAVVAGIAFFFARDNSDGPPSSGAQLVVAIENDIQTLDPVSLADPYTSRIVWQIYEGLVGLDEEGRPIPLLAESWTVSDDHRRWTFKLRPGVLYHRSDVFQNAEKTRAVVAEDVRYSYLRFAKGFGSFVFSGLVEGFDAYVSGKAETVSGFVVLDEAHYQVVLTRPDPSFLFRITSPYLGVMPREAVESGGDAFGRTMAVGTGPFRLTERTETQVVLERNQAYWQQFPGNVASLVFRVDKNPELRATRFRNGEYQMMQLQGPLLPLFVQNGALRPNYESRFQLYGRATYNVHYLGVDNRQLPDLHLRRAIAKAVNKGVIVEKLLQGTGKVAVSPVPPKLQGYQPPEGIPFDAKAASADLARSKYDRRPLTLLVSDAPHSEQLGEVVQSDLERIGITVRIEKVDFNTLITRVFSKDRPPLFILFSEWIYGAPELIIDCYNSKRFPNPNLFGYASQEVDALIAQIPETTERARINNLCRQIDTRANADAPAVWLFHLRNTYIMDHRVKGFSVNGHNHWQFEGVTVDQQ